MQKKKKKNLQFAMSIALLLTSAFTGSLPARSFDPTGLDLNFTSVPYILPMEVKMGEYYLRAPSPSAQAAQTGGLQIRNDALTFQLYTHQSADDNLAHVSWIPSLQPGPELHQRSMMSLTWQKRNSFWTVDLRQDFTRRSGIADDLLVGTGLSYGRTVLPSLSLLFGMKTAGVLDPSRSMLGQVAMDYGKVFFTPGLQLRSRSVILETFLDVPVYAYDMKTRTPEAPNSHDVRANIGIRYNR